MAHIYEKCFAAFIDILGFKNLVSNCTNDEIARLFYEIQYSNSHTNIYNYDKDNDELIPVVPRTEVHYRIMSDSEIIYIDANVENALYGLIQYCSFFQRKLLTVTHKPILCRGGISLGDMYVDGEIMFGRGLINAYKLESNAAVYPRIIIPYDLIEENIDMTNRIKCLKKEDGFYAIDYLGMEINSNMGSKLVSSKIIETFLHDSLSKCIDTSIRNKLLYLEKTYNNRLEEYGYR